ncbi:MAG: hypothetical protein MJ246_05660 [Clostridia bacterium]|nr:hypothetical protein [Clostridia bacterium]
MNQIYLKEPKFEELWFRKQLLGDAKNMAFIKGYNFDDENYNAEDGTFDFDETE